MIKKLSVIKNVVALGLVASVLSACVGVIAPAPDAQWVPGHTGRFGQWIPGHYVNGGPAGGVWVPGHYGPHGRWKPGHWN